MGPLMLTRDAILDPATGERWAARIFHNLLRGEVAPAPGRTVAWSGWMADDADPAQDLFPRDYRTWTPEAWSALAAACDRLGPALTEQGGHLLLRPHARQILSDPQACLSFLKDREGQPFRILVDPAAMLTPDMLPAAEDHLARIFGALATHPAAAAVLLSNVAEGPDDSLRPAPLHQGLIPTDLILAAWRRAGPAPVVLLEEQWEGQRALLSPA